MYCMQQQRRVVGGQHWRKLHLCHPLIASYFVSDSLTHIQQQTDSKEYILVCDVCTVIIREKFTLRIVVILWLQFPLLCKSIASQRNAKRKQIRWLKQKQLSSGRSASSIRRKSLKGRQTSEKIKSQVLCCLVTSLEATADVERSKSITILYANFSESATAVDCSTFHFFFSLFLFLN